MKLYRTKTLSIHNQTTHPSMSNEESFSSASQDGTKANSVVVKIALIGDAAIGKTSLMVKYVEDKYDEDYIQTLGVNFMEKKVKIRDASVTFSIWDLGGQREFVNMLPLVCNEAAAILFMFDLSRKSTLASVKEWYRQARGFNKSAVPFMIGTKFDAFQELSEEEQDDITKQARKYAKLMKAPLLYCSAKDAVNIPKIFKVVLAKCFDLNCNLPTVSAPGQPIFEY